MISRREAISTSAQSQCQLCGAYPLEAVKDYANFSRVTSDSKPWPKGGRLFVCSLCGCVQKSVDSEWESEIGRIYNSYSIYHQGEGTEQSVFDNTSGAVSARSERLLH